MSNLHVAEASSLYQPDWKSLAKWHEDGYYMLQIDGTGEISIRLFLTLPLLTTLVDILYRQIVSATRLPMRDRSVMSAQTFWTDL